MKSKIILLFLFLFGFNHTISAQIETLKEDVEFLSSDALEGRQTGTKGEEDAAKYIAKRFKDLKLQD